MPDLSDVGQIPCGAFALDDPNGLPVDVVDRLENQGVLSDSTKGSDLGDDAGDDC